MLGLMQEKFHVYDKYQIYFSCRENLVKEAQKERRVHLGLKVPKDHKDHKAQLVQEASKVSMEDPESLG